MVKSLDFWLALIYKFKIIIDDINLYFWSHKMKSTTSGKLLTSKHKTLHSVALLEFARCPPVDISPVLSCYQKSGESRSDMIVSLTEIL